MSVLTVEALPLQCQWAISLPEAEWLKAVSVNAIDRRWPCPGCCCYVLSSLSASTVFKFYPLKEEGKKTPKIPADQPEHWDLFPSNPLFLTQLYCMCLIWSRHVVLCKFVQINGTLSQSLRLTKHCFACANLWRSKLTRMFYVFWKTKKREDEIQCSSRTVKFPMGGQALILLPVCMWLCVCVCV